MPNIPEDWGNNFYKSGWQPGLEVNEQTGLGEITHVGTDPTTEINLILFCKNGVLIQNITK